MICESQESRERKACKVLEEVELWCGTAICFHSQVNVLRLFTIEDVGLWEDVQS